jgi:hypothetical protein
VISSFEFVETFEPALFASLSILGGIDHFIDFSLLHRYSEE